MKPNLILLILALCTGELYGREKAEESLPFCKCCQRAELIIRSPEEIPQPLPEPTEEFNPSEFKRGCILHPIIRKEKRMGWNATQAMESFFSWFKPEGKGIKLNYKGNTLHFIINYPEIPQKHGFNVFVINLSPNLAKSVERELKKKDYGPLPACKWPMIQIAKVVSNRLIITDGSSRESKIMRGILDNITEFMDFE